MSGTLTIPNVFAPQSGLVPASQLDADYNAIRDYVNAREITFDTLTNRPAPGTAGRFYYATDTVSLFADDGVAWQQVGTGGVGMTLGLYLALPRITFAT